MNWGTNGTPGRVIGPMESSMLGGEGALAIPKNYTVVCPVGIFESVYSVYKNVFRTEPSKNVLEYNKHVFAYLNMG